MAIEISGVNNNDKITASDGVIDTFSGVSFASTISAPSFTGNLTGDVTGNLTGNVNQTSNLLLQIGGSEKIRISSSGQIGIGGANYGTAGQVLTSGGSGGAVSWSTVSGTTINNNADNRVITGSGAANTLNGESTLTYDASLLNITSTTQGLGLRLTNTGNEYTNIQFDAARTSANAALGIINAKWNNNHEVAAIYLTAGDDTTNKDDGKMRFYTSPSGGSISQAMSIDQNGYVTKQKNPAFKAQMTTSYNPGSTGWKTIPYNDDSSNSCFDVGGNFDTSNHRFTAPVDGYYFFGLNQRTDSGDSNYFRVAFGLDGNHNSGGDYPYGHAIYRDNDGFSYYSFSITALNYMTAGQYMIAMGYSNTDTNFYWQNESIFYGFLVQ